MIKFRDALELTGLYRRHAHHGRGHDAHYHRVDALFVMVIGLVGDARSISEYQVLWSGEVLRRVAG